MLSNNLSKNKYSNLKIYKLLSKKNIIFLTVIFIGLISRLMLSSISVWREDEATTFWLALTKKFLNSPFANVSSTGIPNPNFSLLISKIFLFFDSFYIISLTLTIFQWIILYKTLGKHLNRNKFLFLIMISTSTYLIYLTATIWYQYLILIINALFLGTVFEYTFNKKYYLFCYFPIISILPVSIYLGGLANSVLFFLIFTIILFINFKNFKLNFKNKSHLITGIVLFVFVIYSTWYKFFINIDFITLKIQNDASLFPFSRIRDYMYTGYQYSKQFPSFFIEVFSSRTTIFWPYQYIDSTSVETMKILKSTFLLHKIFSIFSIIFVILGSFFVIFKKTKLYVNIEFLLKSIISIIFIYLLSIITPLLGGKYFLNFNIFNLTVFASTFIFFIFFWISSSLIFYNNKLIQLIYNIMIIIFVVSNITLSTKTFTEYNFSNRYELSEADESIIEKNKIVDFIFSKKEGDKLSIYYDLGGNYFDWVHSNNLNYYSDEYYNYIFSWGREFDYLFKKKYNLDNNQEGMLYRTYVDTQFYLGYSYEQLPKDLYKNSESYIFDNYRLIINLDY